MGFMDWFRRKPAAAPSQSKDETAERIVRHRAAAGYRPATPLSFLTGHGNQLPPLYVFYQEIEPMLVHPNVQIALDYYKSGIAGAEFEVSTTRPDVRVFVEEQLERLWSVSLPRVQEGYDYGWLGAEIIYRRDELGRLAFDDIKTFHPRDVRLLNRGHEYYGVRVSNVAGSNGDVDLWGPCVGVAKGFWYAHRARRGSVWGTSQILGAWRPWRRLAYQDGGEDVLDMAVYRFGIRGPVVKYPPGMPNVDPARRDPRGPSNEEAAQDLAEKYKAGGSITLPSTRDNQGNPQWEVDLPHSGDALNVDSLLNYAGDLEKQISLGCGVPPELLQAADTGSGYSGRQIPLEAFYDGQQTVARDIVRAFREQVIEPLVRWNFGPDAGEVDIFVLPLLQTRQKRIGGPGAMAQPAQRERGPDGRFHSAVPGAMLSTWNEDDHPRGDDGRFIKKEEIAEAKRNPDKADSLRARVTNPKQRRKLEAALRPSLFDDEVADAARDDDRSAPPPPAPRVPPRDETADEEADEADQAATFNKFGRDAYAAARAEGQSHDEAMEVGFKAAMAGGRPVVPPETPRQEAEASVAEKVADYEFARASAVPNAGEDLKGSARHKRNLWRGLAEAEADGSAEELVTRDNLLQAEPPEFMANMTADTAVQHLIAHLALSKFPAVPYDPAKQRIYLASGYSSPETLRRQYYEAYREIRDRATELAKTGGDPREMITSLRKSTSAIINRLREVKVTAPNGASVSDRFNPVANSLVPFANALSTYRPGPMSVVGRLNEFTKKAIEKYGAIEGNGEAIFGHVQDILEGDSINKTFGTVKGRDGEPTYADYYVKHATRKGGRVIDSATVKAGTDYVIQSLRMRGLQWGNSVTDDERQHHLKQASEAFADLADMTGLDDSAMSLGGVLGLAIGARGKGSARAHYEPDSKVINLTRKNGVGSLAHEWGHALDNLLGGGQGRHLSSRPEKTGDAAAGEMVDLMEAMESCGFVSRLKRAVGAVSLSDAKKKYWLSPEERFARAFEKHVQSKLRQAGRENTYLVGTKDHEFWPTVEESAAMAPAFDALLAAVAKSGVIRRITELATRVWDEGKHPRAPKGGEDGGQFVEAHMSLDQFSRHLQQTGRRGDYGPGMGGVRLAHRTHVQDALRAGVGIPESVRSAYPDLAERYQHVKPTTHRQDMARDKRQKRAKFEQEAAEEGIDPSDLHSLAAELLQLDRAEVDEHNRMLADARASLDRYGKAHKMMNARSARGGGGQIEDATHVAGIDVVAREMAGQYPGRFGKNYGYDSRAGVEDDTSSEILFGYLQEGNRPRMTTDEAYDQALRRLSDQKREERLYGRAEELAKPDDTPDVPELPGLAEGDELQPWEQTREQYSASRSRNLLTAAKGYHKSGFIGLPKPDRESSRKTRLELASAAGLQPGTERYVDAVTSWPLHKLHVAAALGRGEAVPDRVLRQYGDLAPATVMLATKVPAQGRFEEIATILAGVIGTERKRLAKAIRRILTTLPPARWWLELRTLLDGFRADYAQALTVAKIAATLAAIRRVVDGSPARLPAAVDSAPPAEPLPVEVWITPATVGASDDDQPIVSLTMIEEAARDLAGRRLLTRSEFDALAADQRAEAFTVAGITHDGVMATVRDLVAEAVDLGESRDEWAKKVESDLGINPFLSPAHEETVFRTNVHQAYSAGMMKILDNDLVGDHFPYIAIDPILDSRVRPWHAALNTAGIDGTNIYRRDDPVLKTILPPSDYNCRCGWRPVTLEQAAAAGVREAQEWLRTGVPPARPTWVSPPANWQQSPNWSAI